MFPTRGSGVLRRGQHSWNISVTKEARAYPKVVLELSTECPSWRIFICPWKKSSKQTNIFQNYTSSSLIGYKTGRAHLRALKRHSFVCLALSFPPLSSLPYRKLRAPLFLHAFVLKHDFQPWNICSEQFYRSEGWFHMKPQLLSVNQESSYRSIIVTAKSKWNLDFGN